MSSEETEKKEFTLEHFLQARGVRGNACERCRGLGCYWYGNTATWRGGVGGAAMTRDVCDVCWGSGDKGRPFTNLREWMNHDNEMSREQSFKYLQSYIGGDYKTMKSTLLHFADIIEKETRKRKIPEGIEEYWYKQYAERFAIVIRRLCGEEVDLW